LAVYLLTLVFVLTLTYKEFKRIKFNFNVFFSILYLLTFYLGFPLTCLLSFRYNVPVAPVENLMEALLAAAAFYAIYYVSYKTRWFNRIRPHSHALLKFNRVETHLVWVLLALVAISTVAIFFMHNGFLLFRLQSYSQIFSRDVAAVALKRFFYFFIPAMLILFFLNPYRRNWLIFLASTVAFGIFTYIVIGGTRANIIIAFALFLFIGIQRGWISLWMLGVAGVMAVAGMFWLALKRYGLNVKGDEEFYTFLYLTRDTFSPWENLALLLQNYAKIDFQGLAPIVRDFYVFIPGWLWPDRPNLVLNTANYFTWNVLNNHSGLAISPTVIGSLVVMGGAPGIALGAIVVGLILKGFDTLYERGKAATDRYRSAVLQAFCFGAVFNIIVLVREGIDSFVSRIVFFAVIFGCCLILAKLIYRLLDRAGLIRPRYTRQLSSCRCVAGRRKENMNNLDGVPHYQIRGQTLWGFRNQPQCVNYLFADGAVKTGCLVAINAEKVLNAERDAVLAQLLAEAEIKYADGISIVRAIRRKYPTAQITRIAGADLFEGIMQRAGEQRTPVFLLGGKPAVLEQTAKKLREKWNVVLVGCQDGYFSPEEQPALLSRIRASGAAIVTVALGSPKQEKFMRECRRHYPQALYMGVGGTYDVFTGHVKRAPLIWRNMGLEWLYRLVKQPSRVWRQLKLLRFVGYYISRRL